MYKAFTIISKTGEMHIQSSTEMGGGVDGYYLTSVTGEPYDVYVQIPHTYSPDEEWACLSDIGKAEIRRVGWANYGTFEHAIAKALNYLNFNHDDALFYEQQVNVTQTTLKMMFENLLESDLHKSNVINNVLDEYRMFKKILYVYNHLKEFENYFPSNWVAPVN